MSFNCLVDIRNHISHQADYLRNMQILDIALDRQIQIKLKLTNDIIVDFRNIFTVPKY